MIDREKQLLQMIEDSDEALCSSKYEYVCLNDYSTLHDALDDVISAYLGSEIVREFGEEPDFKDDLFTDEEKRNALAEYLEDLADQARKNEWLK